MMCEETFIFQTKKECDAAWSDFNPEGWWYAIEDDGDWPWEKAWKDYVDKAYEGKEEDAPKIYWLRDLKIKKVKEWKKRKS